jgi:hypothetical protein
MNANITPHQLHKPAPERAYLVRPAAAHHAAALQTLAQAAYDVTPREADLWFNADQYQTRMAVFPEGQIVALERASGRVVGFTSAMRFHFQDTPDVPFCENWYKTTGYG